MLYDSEPTILSAWSTVVETVTKPVGTTILYQYSITSGKDWSGTWISAAALQTALQAIIPVGNGNDTIRLKFQLSTTDVGETPIINLVVLTSTYQTMTHDIDTIVDYIWVNWRNGKIKPTKKIFRLQGDNNSMLCLWMYPRAIKFIEDETYYELADISGTVDRQNDTVLKAVISSKTKPSSGSYDDHVKEMFDELLYHLHNLARLGNIGTYAYLFANTKNMIRSRFKSRLEFIFLLTRKGRGHDT